MAEGAILSAADFPPLEELQQTLRRKGKKEKYHKSKPRNARSSCAENGRGETEQKRIEDSAPSTRKEAETAAFDNDLGQLANGCSSIKNSDTSSNVEAVHIERPRRPPLLPTPPLSSQETTLEDQNEFRRTRPSLSKSGPPIAAATSVPPRIAYSVPETPSPDTSDGDVTIVQTHTPLLNLPPGGSSLPYVSQPPVHPRLNLPSPGPPTPPSSASSSACDTHSKTPWRIRESYLPHIRGLHQEIEDFYEYIRPTTEESEMRCWVVRRMYKAIHSRWRNAYIEVYGSFRTGLYLPVGDIDMVIIGRWSHEPPLRALVNLLIEENLVLPHHFKILDRASVPIVKIVDAETDVRVDISFNNLGGLRAVSLIKDLCRKYPCFPKLVMVLKQFLYQRCLNEVFTGGVSSYSVILMTASFLQLHPRGKEVCHPEVNLGVLLMEFFELYGRIFQYDTVAIRVTDNGGYCTKEEREVKYKLRGSSPSARIFSLNKFVYARSRVPPIITGGTRLCIEDPFLPGHDVSKGSYQIDAMIEAFDWAFVELSAHFMNNPMDKPSEESVLGKLIQISPEVIEYRRWVQTESPQLIRDWKTVAGGVPPLPLSITREIAGTIGEEDTTCLTRVLAAMENELEEPIVSQSQPGILTGVSFRRRPQTIREEDVVRVPTSSLSNPVIPAPQPPQYVTPFRTFVSFNGPHHVMPDGTMTMAPRHHIPFAFTNHPPPMRQRQHDPRTQFRPRNHPEHQQYPIIPRHSAPGFIPGPRPPWSMDHGPRLGYRIRHIPPRQGIPSSTNMRQHSSIHQMNING
ncbi:unnamed protein product [Cyprideis torosa]|uniref:polynucleotide adenylyltransferase n=1 Tax=Cyprideis torosa TaxID=163714 RepID=A0A7R8ZG26_9CRUS|nr:unnamed protein product [Cyprideis torosa]CAG0880589.1 unnamed protein product [Cyprideis torosa]